jgi:hypothetical protein
MYAATTAAPLERRRAATGEQRRQHADREVDDSRHVGVVVVEAVHQHAVEERGVAHRQTAGEADHGGFAG